VTAGASDFDEQHAPDVRQRAAGPRDSAALEADTPPAPDVWLEQIEDLLESGNSGDAREELQRFRESYPDYEVPERLVDLLPEKPQ